MEALQFWDRVNSLIKKNNKTQKSLSLECNLNPRRIQNLSADNRFPDAYEVYQIAKALNTSVEYLLSGEYSNPAEKELEELKQTIKSFADKL